MVVPDAGSAVVEVSARDGCVVARSFNAVEGAAGSTELVRYLAGDVARFTVLSGPMAVLVEAKVCSGQHLARRGQHDDCHNHCNAPIANGTCTLKRSTSLPATNGASPAPRKRTNPYAAEATGLSTEDTIITAWVVNVLLIPMKIPAVITATTRTVRLLTKIEMTARSAAKNSRAAYRDRAVPYRRCIHGAPTTEKNATSSPQPKNTNPSWLADSSSGNGAQPSIVKNPQLYSSAVILKWATA
jgi:hypothetical protein